MLPALPWWAELAVGAALAHLVTAAALAVSLAAPLPEPSPGDARPPAWEVASIAAVAAGAWLAAGWAATAAVVVLLGLI